MNVFVLCTGRCGSYTFFKACEHIENYTAGHESRKRAIGPGCLTFDDSHIEVDCRMAWRLGRLERSYGRDAFYVHLTRDSALVANSYLAKFYDKKMGIARAWYELMGHPFDDYMPAVMSDMVLSITDNIAAFLSDKEHMNISIEDADARFPEFWERIGAKGNLNLAVAELGRVYNARAA